MQLQVRCKGSHEFDDIFALKLAGGIMMHPEKEHPTFVFQNDSHYQEFKRHKRQLKEADKDGTTNKINKPVGTATSKYTRRRKLASRDFG